MLLLSFDFFPKLTFSKNIQEYYHSVKRSVGPGLDQNRLLRLNADEERRVSKMSFAF